jgi:Zn-dependent protease
LTLFTWKGTPVRLHGSFLFIAGLYVGYELFTQGFSAAAFAVLLGAAVFGSVLLHEMGHAAMARVFGIQTRSITLYPFGGLATLDREPETPKGEALVAIAGPAVNFVLVVVAIPLVLLGLPGAGLFLAVNLGLGLFNLLPAFPMDGGRILRAWWTTKHGRTAATLKALGVSRFFAWAFIALGLMGNASLLLVGGFLLMVVRAERRRWRTAATYNAYTGQEAPWMRADYGSNPGQVGIWAHPPT